MPTFFTRPKLFKRPRRRRRGYRVMASVNECRFPLQGVEREAFELPAMEPDPDAIDYGRAPFELPGVWCREDV